MTTNALPGVAASPVEGATVRANVGPRPAAGAASAASAPAQTAKPPATVASAEPVTMVRRVTPRGAVFSPASPVGLSLPPCLPSITRPFLRRRDPANPAGPDGARHAGMSRNPLDLRFTLRPVHVYDQ